MREVYIPIEQMMQVGQIEIASKPTEAVLIQAQQNKVFHGEFDLTVRGRPSYSGVRGIIMPESVDSNEDQLEEGSSAKKSSEATKKADKKTEAGKKEAAKSSPTPPDMAIERIAGMRDEAKDQDVKKKLDEELRMLQNVPLDKIDDVFLQLFYKGWTDNDNVPDSKKTPQQREYEKYAQHMRQYYLQELYKRGVGVEWDVTAKEYEEAVDRLTSASRGKSEVADSLYGRNSVSINGERSKSLEALTPLAQAREITTARHTVPGYEMKAQMPAGVFDASPYTGTPFESAAERIRREVEAETLQSPVLDRTAGRIESILDNPAVTLTRAERALGEQLLDSIDGLGKGARTIESEGIHIKEDILREAEPFFRDEVQRFRQLQLRQASGGKLTKEELEELGQAFRDKYPYNRHDFERVDEDTVIRERVANQMIPAIQSELAKLGRSIIEDEKAARGERPDDYEKIIELLEKKYERLDELIDGNARDEDKDLVYRDIERAIDSIDFAANSTSYSRILRKLADFSLYDARDIEDPVEKARKSREGKEHYGYALEYAVEKIIGRGDLQPTSDYPQFGFYEGNNLEEMIQGARKWNEGYFSYLNNLKGKRNLSHELFKNLKDRQTLVGIVTKALDPGSFRFIEDEVGGISAVQAIYEKELGRLAGSNVFEGKGWVMFDDYKKIADATVQQMVQKDNAFALERDVKTWHTNAAGSWESKSGARRQMREWERKRAFNMGRALTGAAIRRQIYSMYGDAPEGVADFVKSLEGGEQIMMIMSPLKMIAQRYFSQPGSQRYLNNWHHRKVEEAGEMQYSLKRKRVIDGVEKEMKYGIYGATERATVLLDTGVVDIKSSGWRTDLMFLKQKEYGPAAGMSMYDFFQLKKKAIGEHLEHTNHHYHNIDEMDFKTMHHKSHDARHQFRHDHQVEQVIAQQRLFLGVLMKRPDLSLEHKKTLWKKASDLLPSRIAALMPQFSMDELASVYGYNLDDLRQKDAAKAKWDEINRKLFIAEHARVQADAQGLRWVERRNENGEVVWVQENPSVGNRELRYYIDQYNSRFTSPQDEHKKLSPGDIQVIERWQALGNEMSGQLARVVWPHTPFLDDVPRTDWDSMGRNEMDRLLINDHNDWQEAYGGIVGLIANPAQKPDKLKEIMHHFVEKAKSPTSLGEAQAFGESFIYTYLKMAKKYKMAKATLDLNSVLVPLLKGDFKNLGRIPTSEMEEFNLQSGISYDEADIASILFGLAHLEVISDDPAEADSKGYTALMRLAKELKADGMARLFMMFRYFVQLFGFEFAAQVFSAILPEEVAKAAG